MSTSDFEQAAELAARLTPQEQLRLVAQIGEHLRSAGEPATAELPAGSPASLLQAVREPPQLESSDVEALEHAIQAGRMPTRFDGIFAPRDDS